MNLRIEQLIAQVFADPTDESALAALSARLEASAEDQAYYLDYCRLHGDLFYLASSEGAERRAMSHLASTTLGPSKMLSPQQGAQTSPGAERPVPRGWRKGFFALAASIALVLGWRYLAPSGPQQAVRRPTIVASLVSSQEAVWHGVELANGEEFRVGSRLRLEQGVVKVGTPAGAELLIEGPCDVLLDSPDRIEIVHGKVAVRTADWASGFTVDAKAMKVIDLGEQFAVAVDAQGNAEAHALKGSVRIEPRSALDKARTSFLLGEGEAIRIDVADASTRLAADENEFVLSLGEFRPYRPIVIHNTGRGLRVGDEDAHWRIISGAIGEGYQGEQFAVVCEPDVRYLPNHPLVSQWMSVAKDLRPGCLPNSSYVFQTEVDLTGYDLSTVRILADVLADNGVAQVRINGQSVDLEPWRDNEYLQEFHQFRRAEISGGFVAGKNMIDIYVWNGIYQADPARGNSEPTPNPMAVRVEWQAFGVPLSTEPDGNDVI